MRWALPVVLALSSALLAYTAPKRVSSAGVCVCAQLQRLPSYSKVHRCKQVSKQR